MKNVFWLAVLFCVGGFAATQVVTFDNNWGEHPLINLVASDAGGVQMVFSMHQLVIEEQEIDGTVMKSFSVPAVFIADPGVPNLGGVSRWLALPQGARARVTVLDARTEVYRGVEVAPASNIPRDNDDAPLRYAKNVQIYGKDAYWPVAPVVVGQQTDLRGVDVVLLSVLPFQYNPVTKELIVYKDIRFRVDFEGGNGHFGVDRLRSRFWDPVLENNLLNFSQLPQIDYYAPERFNARAGYEYIIIVPDDPVFIAWGDTLKRWRKLQGISCEVYTTTQCGGNDTAHIKTFLQNAYSTWNPAPVAFLILSDFNPSGDVYGVPATRLLLLGETVASDNWYADMNSDNLPDLDHGRICAQTNAQLDTIIRYKMLSMERNPSTNAGFYANPIVAAAWQTERWFQLAGEVVRQFLINGLGKTPARLYAVYGGTPTPGCAWSSRQGTRAVVQYWHNMGWLPDTLNQGDVAWWSTGNNTTITNAINAGAWFVQHRDHGAETAWGEPAYSNSDVLNLTNTNNMFPYINSSNCLTGKYIYSGECMTERFHRDTHCAVGINGASEVSYSFVNDAYIWGIWDGLFPRFDAGYPNFDLVGHHNMRPCQAMTHGKIYLHTMWFADSAGLGTGGYREITDHLFHHHGDCFMTLNSVIPQNLTVSHPPTLTAGMTTFPVSANDSSVIALTVAGEIIGVAMGTGSTVNITIPAQVPGTVMKVTVTRWNYFRYSADVNVVSSSYPYVTMATQVINAGGDGVINPGETVTYGVYGKNVGQGTAQQVYGLLSEADAYVTVGIDSAWYGNIAQNDSARSTPDYQFTVASNCPNAHNIDFVLHFYDINDSIFTSYKTLTVYAPVLTYVSDTITGGNNNGMLDPSETANLVVTIRNEGGAVANNVTSTLMESSPYITISDASGNFGTINVAATANNNSDPYVITCASGAPIGDSVLFQVALTSGFYIDTIQFYVGIGKKMPTDTGYYYTYWSGGPYVQCPVYSWYAIDTTQAVHVGTSLNLADDTVARVGLSFTFRYYGVNYTRLSISSNGFVALDSATSSYVTNYGLPSTSSPPTCIAGLWDDLDPGNTGAPSDIYYYNDATNHRFLVEFFRVEHYSSGYQETFEFILYDPAYYATPTGDGEIIVQYMYAMQQADNTLGIQNSARTVGIQYYLDGTYHSLGVPVTNQFALKYTTVKPTIIGIEEAQGLTALPAKTGLEVYPTVSKNAVCISYSVNPNTENVALKVYDATGRLVKSFAVSPSSATQHGGLSQSIVWQGTDDAGRLVPAGVYFVHLVTDNNHMVEKTILLR